MPYKDKEKEKAAKQRYEEKRKRSNGDRRKVWTLIFYPDSAPEDWREQLSQLHMKVWVSPIHDNDVWTSADEKRDKAHKAGMPKKPHYHLVCQYEVQVDRDGFLEDFGFLNGPQNVKAVKSLGSMVRYLVHADDPDKAQYAKEDVSLFGGAEVDLVEQLGSHERHEALRAMRVFIRDHQIVDFCTFIDYCDECEVTWARLLDDNSSYVIEKYIKSLRYRLRDEAQASEKSEIDEALKNGQKARAAREQEELERLHRAQRREAGQRRLKRGKRR